jgi:hypothetical protein
MSSQAPPSLLAYSSSILSSYNLSASFLLIPPLVISCLLVCVSPAPPSLLLDVVVILRLEECAPALRLPEKAPVRLAAADETVSVVVLRMLEVVLATEEEESCLTTSWDDIASVCREGEREDNVSWGCSEVKP